MWAEERGIPIKKFHANVSYNLSPSKTRNTKMAKYADAAILFHDGTNIRIKDLINKMNKLNKPVHIVKVKFTQPKIYGQ
jgi:hypothetical protein